MRIRTPTMPVDITQNRPFSAMEPTLTTAQPTAPPKH